MDLTKSAEPDSTQVNADDLISGPVVVTITAVREGTSEQPVNIDVAEFPDRAYRPSKSMRRVLIACWGADSSAYIGRRMKLYRDPEVTFGRDKVGGIKIGALSDIDKKVGIALTISRGSRKPHVVEPLTDAPTDVPAATVTPDDVAACESIPTLRGWWKKADADTRTLIESRVKALEEAALGEDGN